MAACLVRHDVPEDVAVPRLTLVTTRTISAPVGCHHCADAPCVDACPVGCLFSDNDHVGVHAGKCIGCRNCVLACPYGAIDIVTRTVAPEPEPAPEPAVKTQATPAETAAIGTSVLRSAAAADKGEPPSTEASSVSKAAADTAPTPAAQGKEKPKVSARDRARARAKKRRSSVSTVVKCDLCIACANGPACVHACPTKALRLIDPEMIERGKQAKRKAAARASASFASIALNTKLDEER